MQPHGDPVDGGEAKPEILSVVSAEQLFKAQLCPLCRLLPFRPTVNRPKTQNETILFTGTAAADPFSEFVTKHLKQHITIALIVEIAPWLLVSFFLCMIAVVIAELDDLMEQFARFAVHSLKALITSSCQWDRAGKEHRDRQCFDFLSCIIRVAVSILAMTMSQMTLTMMMMTLMNDKCSFLNLNCNGFILCFVGAFLLFCCCSTTCYNSVF